MIPSSAKSHGSCDRQSEGNLLKKIAVNSHGVTYNALNIWSVKPANGEILVLIGFEPKIAFICPLCSKEVDMVYEKGKDWTSEHSNCLNFSVIRNVPKVMGKDLDAPLIFINLESDFSIKDAIEGLRRISREDVEQVKKQKLESGLKRLESRLGFSEKNLDHIMDALKSGAFGIRVVSGRDVYALLWKSGERYFGIADSKDSSLRDNSSFAATSSLDEAQKYACYWLHYWETASALP